MLRDIKKGAVAMSISPESYANPNPASPLSDQVLSRLRDLCEERGLEALAENLIDLMSVVGTDMAQLEAELATIARSPRLAEKAAAHLIDLGGKRLRPLCVALAARAGNGFDERGLELAVAVELVHNATLLHDDVIDMATDRRGKKASRVEFGNAASIFAGDWLLIEALQRVHRSEVPGALDHLLETIAEMIRAESLQLEQRGNVDLSLDTYFSIAEGKSATLFQWAMRSGAAAGGLSPDEAAALEAYGGDLGIAFQIIDDLLDITSGVKRTGKPRFADLREGKMTYPVIVAFERDPSLREVLEQLVASDPLDEPDLEFLEAVGERVEATGALEDCRKEASSRVERAIESLSQLPTSEATMALTAVARSTVHRLK